MGDRLPAPRWVLPRCARHDRETARRRRCLGRDQARRDGGRRDGVLRTELSEANMARTYNVVDADGHILEPLNLWTDYIDPAYRDRAPRLIKNNKGAMQLQIDSALLGYAERGLGAIGAIGARDGHVIAEGFDYK